MSNKLNADRYDGENCVINPDERDLHDIDENGGNGLVIFIGLLVFLGLGGFILPILIEIFRY